MHPCTARAMDTLPAQLVSAETLAIAGRGRVCASDRTVALGWPAMAIKSGEHCSLPYRLLPSGNTWADQLRHNEVHHFIRLGMNNKMCFSVHRRLLKVYNDQPAAIPQAPQGQVACWSDLQTGALAQHEMLIRHCLKLSLSTRRRPRLIAALLASQGAGIPYQAQYQVSLSHLALRPFELSLWECVVLYHPGAGISHSQTPSRLGLTPQQEQPYPVKTLVVQTATAGGNCAAAGGGAEAHRAQFKVAHVLESATRASFGEAVAVQLR
eukprot:scaffold722_cov255-Prasinococcus_capsulatus_cf.AAC.3